MLKNPRTAPTALELIEKRLDDGFVRALLSDASIVSNARVTSALSGVHYLPWLRSGVAQAAALPAKLAVRAVRLLLATATPAAEKRATLERFARTKNVALAAAAKFVLAAAARRLSREKTDAALATIEERCPEPPSLAAQQASRRAKAGGAPSDARVTDRTLFRNFVNSFETLSRSEREAAAGDFARKRVFAPELTRALADLEPDVVLRAIRIVEWRGCQAELSPALIALTRHPDGRIRSAAVKQLGKSATYDALKALFRPSTTATGASWQTPSRRSRPPGTSRSLRLLEPLMKHPDNRVRANAAKAAWSLGSDAGRAALVEMLRSPKSDMRLSGLWGLKQIGAREEAPLIRELARADSDEKVRKVRRHRAGRAGERRMSPLAQVSPDVIARSVKTYTSGSAGRFLPELAVLGAVIVAGLLAWALWSFLKARRRPLLLFNDLAALHGLRRSARRRLVHLARTHRVPDPAVLFVCPDLVRQIQSLETSEAAGDRQRRRVEAFFSGFTATVFGADGGQTAGGPK